MVKFKKFMAALLSGAMLLGVTASAVPAPVATYAAEEEIASVKIICNYSYFDPVKNKNMSYSVEAQAYNSSGKEIWNYRDFQWSLEVDGDEVTGNPGEGNTEESVYLDRSQGDCVNLSIGENVPNGTKIKITATSVSNPEIKDFYTATVDTSEKTATSIKLKTENWGEYGEPGETGTRCFFSIQAYAADETWIWNWDYDPEQIKWKVDDVNPWPEDKGDPNDIEESPEESFFYIPDNNEPLALIIGTKEKPGKEIKVSATYGEFSTSSTVTVWKRMATEIFINDEDISKNMEPGDEIYISASACDLYDILYDDIKLSVTGVEQWVEDEMGEPNEEQSYFTINSEDEYVEISELFLHIGTEEKIGKKITITAASKSNPSLFVSRTITVWKPVTTTIELQYRNGDRDKYATKGTDVGILAKPYDQNHDDIEDTISWSVTGATNFVDIDNLHGKPTKKQTYLLKDKEDDKKISLHIGEDEPNGTKITVTATSESGISNSCTITVFDGISFDINYKEGSAYLRSYGEDSFLFLEICKKEKDPKGKGTIYCYEGNDISVDLSTMKLSKPVYVYVYGNVKTDPVAYTIAAQPKKTSVKFKYDPGKKFAECFTLKDVKIDELEYRRQNETSWKPLSELEEELDQLMVTGANLLVRQSGMDTKEKRNMPGTEIKLKISAAPKAPKIKLNYAKNTITLAKNSQVRVPGWEVFSGKVNADGEYEKVPFYYSAGEDKDKLNLSPEKLAETLLTEYITAYDKSVAEINKNGVKESLLTEQAKEKLSGDLEDDYTLLIRTSDSKKGNSQPAFVEVKAAPVIGIKPKTTSGSAVVAVVTGENTYGNNSVKITYDTSIPNKETIKLTASSDNLFGYSLDGKKFTKIKSKGTTVKLSQITGSDIIIRMEGAEDKKKPESSRWASNEVRIPKTEK